MRGPGVRKRIISRRNISMNMGRTGATLGFAVAGMLLMAGSSEARVCQGNAEIQGAFGFSASRFGLVGSPLAFTGSFTGTAVTPPGTTTGTGTGTGTGGTGTGTGQTGTAGSNLPPLASTGAGGLVTGAAVGEPFARTGLLFADGVGGLFVDSAQLQQAGTYSVNPDCSVTVSLNNAFAFATTTTTGTGTQTGTGSTGTTAALSAPSTVTFDGVIVEGGEEIDLVQTGTVGGTTMTWRKTTGTCSDNDLFGDFGIAGTATAVTTSTSGLVFTPFAIAGRLQADGLGLFTTDAFSIATANPQQVLVGTYTVNPDCTGKALVSGFASALDFVIVRELTVSIRVPGAQSTVVAQPVMLFDLTGSGIIGSGAAKPQ